MRVCFYCGESKINSIYNDMVDRSVVEIQETTGTKKQAGIKADAKVTLGKLCSFLGLSDFSAGLDVNLQEERANSQTVVTKLAPEQMQKIIEAKAKFDQGTLKLSKALKILESGGPAQFVSHKIHLKLDHDKTPPKIVKQDKSAVLSGRSDKFDISIRTALSCFVTETTWLRFKDHEKPAKVFGLVTFVDMDKKVADIEPLLLYYA